ncbi:MAG TPA: hypothetical protein VGC29_08070 [Flavisolibacter sp.]
MMDPYYRDAKEKGSTNGRSSHLGVDITGPTAGDGSITDPRRGLPVYAAVNTLVALDQLNTVRAFDKNAKTSSAGLGIQGSGDAQMVEAKIYTQPWSSTEDHSYGGVVGMSCIYSYQNNNGSSSEFTLYIEFLHLITEQFLPKNKAGHIASLSEWQDTGRGIGFGPDIQNNAVVQAGFFTGPGFPVIGYLGATQTPHVHVQVAYFDRRSYDKMAVVRIDPMVVVY